MSSKADFSAPLDHKYLYDDFQFGNLIYAATQFIEQKWTLNKDGQTIEGAEKPVFIMNTCLQTGCSSYQRFMNGLVTLGANLNKKSFVDQPKATAEEGENAVSAFFGGLIGKVKGRQPLPAPPPKGGGKGGGKGKKVAPAKGNKEGVLVGETFTANGRSLHSHAKIYGMSIIFGFHGTSDAGVPAISCLGFDCTKRSGQAYGQGEYFAREPSLSAGYTRGFPQQLMVAIICCKSLNFPNDTMYVVNNPTDHVEIAYQVPLGVVVYGNLDTRIEFFKCLDPCTIACTPEEITALSKRFNLEFETTRGVIQQEKGNRDKVISILMQLCPANTPQPKPKSTLPNEDIVLLASQYQLEAEMVRELAEEMQGNRAEVVKALQELTSDVKVPRPGAVPPPLFPPLDNNTNSTPPKPSQGLKPLSSVELFMLAESFGVEVPTVEALYEYVKGDQDKLLDELEKVAPSASSASNSPARSPEQNQHNTPPLINLSNSQHNQSFGPLPLGSGPMTIHESFLPHLHPSDMTPPARAITNEWVEIEFEGDEVTSYPPPMSNVNAQPPSTNNATSGTPIGQQATLNVPHPISSPPGASQISTSQNSGIAQEASGLMLTHQELDSFSAMFRLDIAVVKDAAQHCHSADELLKLLEEMARVQQEPTNVVSVGPQQPPPKPGTSSHSSATSMSVASNQTDHYFHQLSTHYQIEFDLVKQVVLSLFPSVYGLDTRYWAKDPKLNLALHNLSAVYHPGCAPSGPPDFQPLPQHPTSGATGTSPSSASSPPCRWLEESGPPKNNAAVTTIDLVNESSQSTTTTPPPLTMSSSRTPFSSNPPNFATSNTSALPTATTNNFSSSPKQGEQLLYTPFENAPPITPDEYPGFAEFYGLDIATVRDIVLDCQCDRKIAITFLAKMMSGKS